MSLLVTGGAGSLGRAILKAALAAGEDRPVSYDQDEYGGFMLSDRLSESIRIINGDVRDPIRLSRAMAGCRAVIHCAAKKWVQTGVYNVDELVDVNVNGTQAVIEAAHAAGVPSVLVITSDKGVEPTNAYGATKFLAECYTTQANAWTYPQGTRAACLRLGNLLWSRGSVAHRWRAALALGKPLLLTRPGMSRFGIPLTVAAALALELTEVLRGGEVFVPDLPAYTLDRLAVALDESAETVLTGDRGPGEKLAETLVSGREAGRLVPISLAAWPRVGVLEPESPSWTRPPWANEGTWTPPAGAWVSDTAVPMADLALDELDDE